MKTSMVAALLTAAAALVTVAFLARSWRAPAPRAPRLPPTNGGPRAGSLEVLDDLPEPLEVTKGASHGFLTLAPRASVDLAYTVVPRIKGEYAIGPVVLRAADPLGPRYEESRLEVEDRLVAVPRLADLRRGRIVPRRRRPPPAGGR